MYELMQAGPCDYYMDCPSKVGFIVLGDEVCLVDTGGDKDAGKKALRLAQGRGWRVKLVLNTPYRRKPPCAAAHGRACLCARHRGRFCALACAGARHGLGRLPAQSPARQILDGAAKQRPARRGRGFAPGH